VARIANEVWSDVDGTTVKSRSFGSGFVYDGVRLEEVMAEQGLEPDVRLIGAGEVLCAVSGAGKMSIGSRGGVTFQHRSDGTTDIYFLANTSNKPVTFTASLRCTGRRPILWDAVTGTLSPAESFTQENGRTHIPLHLQGSESIYVVFEETIGPGVRGTADSNIPVYRELAVLDGRWTARFDGQGAPEKITFDRFQDWSKHELPSLRHYAGTAIYEKDFTLDDSAGDKPVILELGPVGVIARVVVNGREAGTVWTTPWQIDITDVVKPGSNKLEIHVTNTWNNRLVADAALPVEQRHSYVSQPYRFNAKAPLVSGGLMGPVILKQER
jgi:hypothetical protein